MYGNWTASKCVLSLVSICIGSFVGQEPNSNAVILLMMDVYRQALQVRNLSMLICQFCLEIINKMCIFLRLTSELTGNQNPNHTTIVHIYNYV